MKQKTVNLWGKTFTIKKPIERPIINTRDLDACYGRPSTTKQAIYNEWSEWFQKMGSRTYGVNSYNCNFFTISGIVYDISTDTDYYVYITRTRQELYPIN